MSAAGTGLEALHAAVQQRIGQVVSFGAMPGYEPLRQRFVRVMAGGEGQQAVAAMEADLQELSDAPDETLRRMVAQRAVNARCVSEATAAHLRGIAAAQHMVDMRSGLHPRVSPTELVAQFAARGVMVRAVDGMLHVSPPEALFTADREVLMAHKAGIIDALARPAAVL